MIVKDKKGSAAYINLQSEICLYINCLLLTSGISLPGELEFLSPVTFNCLK